MKIVLASNNPGKLREFSDLLQPFKLEVIPQGKLGIPDAEETGLTFIENAIIKARHAAHLTGLPALADDSGLAVAALNGAPGIYSARYAGAGAKSSDNIHKLLQAMTDIPDDKRQASFHCVLAFMMHANDPTPLISDGSWHGQILRAPQGENGFGYDPVFFVPSEQCSSAQLPASLKNKLSHRAQAINSLIKFLPDKLHECIIS